MQFFSYIIKEISRLKNHRKDSPQKSSKMYGRKKNEKTRENEVESESEIILVEVKYLILLSSVKSFFPWLFVELSDYFSAIMNSWFLRNFPFRKSLREYLIWKKKCNVLLLYFVMITILFQSLHHFWLIQNLFFSWKTVYMNKYYVHQMWDVILE